MRRRMRHIKDLGLAEVVVDRRRQRVLEHRVLFRLCRYIGGLGRCIGQGVEAVKRITLQLVAGCILHDTRRDVQMILGAVFEYHAGVQCQAARGQRYLAAADIETFHHLVA